MPPAPAAVLLASAAAVAKVALVATGGAYMRRADVLDTAARKSLSALTFQLTLPAFLFTSISPAIAPEHLARLLPMPAAACVYVAVGAALGIVVARATGASSNISGAVMLACSLGNSNNLPVVLAQAIARFSPELLGGEGPDGSQTVERLCVTYVGAYLSVFSCLLWSIAPVVLARNQHAATDAACDDTANVELAAIASTSVLTAHDEDNISEQQGLLAATNPNVPRGGSLATALSRIKVPPLLAKAFPLPVLSVLAGILCGLVPAFHAHFISPQGTLHVAFAALETLGQAAVPTSVILLGAGLAKGPDFTHIHPRTCIGIALVRLVILPAIAFGIVALVAHLTGTAVLPNDPPYRFVLLLQAATPSANNLIILTTIYSGDEVATSIAAAMFVQYCFAPFTLTAAISVILAYVGR